MNDLRNEFESHSAFAFEGFVKSSALLPQNKSDDLSSSKKMSACFQSICQRANAISEKLFYNSSQSLSCELAEKKKVGSSFMSALFIKFLTPRSITVRTVMMV